MNIEKIIKQTGRGGFGVVWLKQDDGNYKLHFGHVGTDKLKCIRMMCDLINHFTHEVLKDISTK